MTEFIYTNSIGLSSSTMQAAYWNKDTSQLAIHFWNGSVVRYDTFTENAYRTFADSLSKGSFYNRYIKGSYPGSKMSDDTVFVHKMDKVSSANMHPQNMNAVAPEPTINVTVNIYVSGDPEDIAKAVERLAPSIRAITQKENAKF